VHFEVTVGLRPQSLQAIQPRIVLSLGSLFAM